MRNSGKEQGWEQFCREQGETNVSLFVDHLIKFKRRGFSPGMSASEVFSDEFHDEYPEARTTSQPEKDGKTRAREWATYCMTKQQRQELMAILSWQKNHSKWQQCDFIKYINFGFVCSDKVRVELALSPWIEKFMKQNVEDDDDLAALQVLCSVLSRVNDSLKDFVINTTLQQQNNAFDRAETTNDAWRKFCDKKGDDKIHALLNYLLDHDETLQATARGMGRAQFTVKLFPQTTDQDPEQLRARSLGAASLYATYHLRVDGCKELIPLALQYRWNQFLSQPDHAPLISAFYAKAQEQYPEKADLPDKLFKYLINRVPEAEWQKLMDEVKAEQVSFSPLNAANNEFTARAFDPPFTSTDVLRRLALWKRERYDKKQQARPLTASNNRHGYS